MNGLFNEMTYFNGVPETVQDISSTSTIWAGRSAYGITPRAGPSRATRPLHGPSRSPRTTAGPATAWSSIGQGHQGQGRDPLAVAPRHRHRADDSGSRGLPEPKSRQRDASGSDRRREPALHFDDAKRQSKHTTQYFEIFGNRGIYHDGWLAGTVHRAPWEPSRAHRCRGR